MNRRDFLKSLGAAASACAISSSAIAAIEAPERVLPLTIREPVLQVFCDREWQSLCGIKSLSAHGEQASPIAAIGRPFAEMPEVVHGGSIAIDGLITPEAFQWLSKIGKSAEEHAFRILLEDHHALRLDAFLLDYRMEMMPTESFASVEINLTHQEPARWDYVITRD